MSIYQVMFAGPSDVEREREAFFSSVDSCNRLLRLAEKQAAVLPLHWQTDAVVQSSGLPQPVISRQLLERADALVAVFRRQLGTPTEHARSGTHEEILEARGRKIPCLVCFFDWPQRATDPGQLKKMRDFRKELEKGGLLTFSYRSPALLQVYLTEWLFSLFFLGSRAPRDPRQDELRELVEISDFLWEPPAKAVASVFYTIAGTKTEALQDLRTAHHLAEMARRRGWRVETRSKEEMVALKQEYLWSDSGDARWNEIPLGESPPGSNRESVGHVIYDCQTRTIYLTEALRSRVDQVLSLLHTPDRQERTIEPSDLGVSRTGDPHGCGRGAGPRSQGPS